jgi:hypothetical protein
VVKGFCQNHVEEIQGLAKGSDLRHVGRDWGVKRIEKVNLTSMGEEVPLPEERHWGRYSKVTCCDCDYSKEQANDQRIL